ncbi:MAG TPA: COQ9 family protein [Alphaproteobacteria bacterium]|nr:COQ9 family protein [Alphaproteobacteria bacterium]HOO49979.1 COQ9 family protein [Alphaproteobacteria bacterium]
MATIQELKDKVLESVLPDVYEQGWSWAMVQKAALECGLQDRAEKTLFPNGLLDVVAHFSDYTDRHMLSALEDLPYDALRSKDRVRAALMARYSFLEPHREAVRHALAFWALPSHVVQSQRVLWRTSDRIWSWAGDVATDYSRHTKRAMLSSIIIGTSMVWITDDSKDIMVTQAFLDRRLENAMEIGKTIGTMKTVIPNLFRQTRSR